MSIGGRPLGALAFTAACALGAAACSGGSGTASAPPGAVSDDVPDHASDAAVTMVDEEFSGCRALGIDVIGGSTAVRPRVAEAMLRLRGRDERIAGTVPAARVPLVVVLREGDMVLVELGPGRRHRPVPFNGAAVALLRAARAAEDHCGTVARDRYASTPPSSA